MNLDFESEADMVDKFRVSLALQPLATALFANSPFLDGRPSGFKSYRSHVWCARLPRCSRSRGRRRSSGDAPPLACACRTDVDKARTGDLPFVFEKGFGFERCAAVPRLSLFTCRCLPVACRQVACRPISRHSAAEPADERAAAAVR